jgi:hypothetical protein
MAKKNKQTAVKTPQEKLKEAENLLLTNSKDDKFAKQLIKQIKSLQKEIDLSSVELIVPVKSITDEIDYGAVKIQRCAQGFLFTAKGGLQTLVSWRMKRVCRFLDQLFIFKEKAAENEEEARLRGLYAAALQYVYQAPLFASASEESLMDIATCIVDTYGKFCRENIDNAEEHEETEEDVKENIELEAEINTMQRLIEEADKLPNYDEDEA